MNTVTLETPSNDDSVKVGQYYKNIKTKELYIVSEVGSGKYALISIKYGNRFINSISYINEIFADKKQDFELIKPISRITIVIE